MLFNSTDNSESFLEMCEKLHLPFSDYPDIKKYYEDKGLKFLATPFDLPSIDFLDELGLKTIKVPSGEQLM